MPYLVGQLRRGTGSADVQAVVFVEIEYLGYEARADTVGLADEWVDSDLHRASPRAGRGALGGQMPS
jgi:hypothetical protein